MNDKNDGYLFIGFVCALCLAMSIAFWFGVWRGVSTTYQEAAILGHGDYVMPPWEKQNEYRSQLTVFKWREKCGCSPTMREAYPR